MNNFLIGKAAVILLFCFLLLPNMGSAQSNAQASEQKAQVKKQISADTQILTFTNKLDVKSEKVTQFEDKIRKANFPGLIDVSIKPKTATVEVTYQLDVTEEELRKFFNALGYNEFVISK